MNKQLSGGVVSSAQLLFQMNPRSLLHSYSFLAMFAVLTAFAAATGTNRCVRSAGTTLAGGIAPVWTRIIQRMEISGCIQVSPDSCGSCEAGPVAAKAMAGDSIFRVAINRLQRAATDGHEHSITFGSDSAGLSASPMADGNPTNGRVLPDWPGAVADLHNHRHEQPPSAGDLFHLVRINSKNPRYRLRFVATPGGTLYALYICDPKKAAAFVAKYHLEQTPGFSPRFPEPIFDDVDKVTIYFEGQGNSRLHAQESALAFVLARYQSGVSLLRQEATGNFAALYTLEDVLNSTVGYRAANCR